jgi:hypothetical protein
MALVGYGHSVEEIDLTGTKPLVKKVVFRRYKKGQRFAPELYVAEVEDWDLLPFLEIPVGLRN